MKNLANLALARLAATLTVSAMICMSGTMVVAQDVKNGGVSGQAISLTESVTAQTTVTMLSVPAGEIFVLTQACFSIIGAGANLRIQNVGGGGSTSQMTLDNTECQDYNPGVVFFGGRGGDDVVFRNNAAAGTTRVLLNGVLIK